MAKKWAKQVDVGHFGEEQGYFSDVMKSSGVFLSLFCLDFEVEKQKNKWFSV